MKQQFIVSPLARAPQKFLYGMIAFGLTWFLSWLVTDIVQREEDVEMILLAVFLCVLAPLLALCGLLCLFGLNGVEVDMEAKTWKNYTGLLGLKYGKPSPFPQQMDYILVFEKVRPDAFEMDMGTYEVAIIYNGNRRQVFLESYSRRHAADVSVRLAGLFKLEIIDKAKDQW